MKTTRRSCFKRLLSNGGAPFLVLWLLTQSFSSEALAQGCAMCRTALSGGDDPLAQGIFWSVLLLMAAPFVVVGSIGGWIFYQYRRARSSQQRLASVLPLHLAPTQKEGQP